jgi:hypothetical protein
MDGRLERWMAGLGRWAGGLGRRVDAAFFGRWQWVLLLALLGLSWPLVAERGLMVESDYPGWAAIASMLDREVLPYCHWFWAVPFPRVNAGEILGQPYSLSIIAPWLLTRILSPEWALKLVILAAYLTLGFGFYCFTAPKSSRLAACLGGYLCVLENLWNVNLGMWYNSLSIGLAFFFFVALERFVETRRTAPWLAAVLLLALTIFAHPLGTVMALAGWSGFFVAQLVRRRSDRTLVLLVLSIPVLGIGLALAQVLATVVGSPVGVGQGTSGQYNPFFMLGLYLSRSILLVSLYGLAGAVGKRQPVLWLILPPLLLAPILYRNWIAALPFAFPLKEGLMGFAYRFMLMASAAALVLFALGVARIQAALRTERRTDPSLARWILGLLVLGAALLGLEQTLTYQPKTLVGENALKDRRDFLALCTWVQKNVDHEAERVYVEDTFARLRDFSLYPGNRLGRFLLRRLGKGATPFTHYMSLLSLRTGCQQVNGFAVYQNPFSKRYCCNGRRLFNIAPEDLPPRVLRERLWALNCRHIVSFSDSMREFLAGIRFLRCSCRFGRFCVFTWSDMAPHYAWSGRSDPQPIAVTRRSAIRYDVALPEVRPTMVYLSLQYHANWKAYLDGTSVRVIPWRGLMRLHVPAGAGGSLQVRYEIRRGGPLGVAGVSVLMILAVVVVRRRACREAPGPRRPSAGASHHARFSFFRRV